MTKRILMELYYLERGILFHFISPKWGMKEGCDNIFSRLVDIALLTKYHFSNIYNIIYWNTKTNKYINELEV